MSEFMTIADFEATDIDGNLVRFSKYMGKVLLIVNTASKGNSYTKLRHMEHLQQHFEGKPFQVLAFPCNQFMMRERAHVDEIKDFYMIRERVNFPVFRKCDVNGKNALPLFKWLKKKQRGKLGKDIEDNFTRFVVEADGKTVHRFAATDSWFEMSVLIEKLVDSAPGVINGSR